MKNLIIILLLVFVPIVLFGQNLKALDEKYGFREMKFEMPLSSLKNHVEVEKGFYKSTTENLKLGDYKLSEVVYSFYKGQLYVIMIETKGFENSSGVLKILQQAYGNGYQSNEYIERYVWFGEKVFMSYDQNSITDDATIYMYCRKLSDLKDADEKKANSKAVDQL